MKLSIKWESHANFQSVYLSYTLPQETTREYISPKQRKNEREIKRIQEIGDLQQERKDRNPFHHLER